MDEIYTSFDKYRASKNLSDLPVVFAIDEEGRTILPLTSTDESIFHEWQRFLAADFPNSHTIGVIVGTSSSVADVVNPSGQLSTRQISS